MEEIYSHESNSRQEYSCQINGNVLIANIGGCSFNMPLEDYEKLLRLVDAAIKSNMGISYINDDGQLVSLIRSDNPDPNY